MIFTFLLSYALAAQQQTKICEQIFDPNYCNGQAAGSPGLTCTWEENECKTVNMNNPKDACKSFNNQQAMCNSHAGCVFDLTEFECKSVDSINKHSEFDQRPEFDHGAKAYLPTSSQYPSANTQSQNQFPATAYNSATPLPSSNFQPMGYNSANLPTTSMTTTTASATNTAVINSNLGFHSTSTTGVAQNSIVQSTASPGPRFCKSLTQLQCFGPSVAPGKLCFWDAEDMECSEATENSIEAVCKQFARDAVACDAHENCFWDEKDIECSEIEFGTFANKPVLTVQCSSFHNLNDCASAASCFWDNTVCINVVQATNVCGVLTSAQACSTNKLCHWRSNVCQIANGVTGAGGLHLQKSHTSETSETGNGLNYFVMFACGFSGALLGLLVSLGTEKVCWRKTSQEDYRDIILDVNSNRRQIV